MTKEQFNQSAEKYLTNLSPERREFLRKLGELVEEYETTGNECIFAQISFQDYRRVFWNGEMFN